MKKENDRCSVMSSSRRTAEKGNSIAAMVARFRSSAPSAPSERGPLPDEFWWKKKSGKENGGRSNGSRKGKGRTREGFKSSYDIGESSSRYPAKSYRWREENDDDPVSRLIEEDINAYAETNEEMEADSVLRSELALAESGSLRKSFIDKERDVRKSATSRLRLSAPSDTLTRSREALKRSVDREIAAIKETREKLRRSADVSSMRRSAGDRRLRKSLGRKSLEMSRRSFERTGGSIIDSPSNRQVRRAMDRANEVQRILEETRKSASHRIGERASALARSVEELGIDEPAIRRDSTVQATCMSMVNELNLEMQKFNAPSLPEPSMPATVEEVDSEIAPAGIGPAADVVAAQMKSLAERVRQRKISIDDAFLASAPSSSAAGGPHHGDMLNAAEMALLQRDEASASPLSDVRTKVLQEIVGAVTGAPPFSRAGSSYHAREVSSTVMEITEDIDVAMLCLNRRLPKAVLARQRDGSLSEAGSIERARIRVDEGLKEAMQEQVINERSKLFEDGDDAGAVEASVEADSRVIVERMVSALHRHESTEGLKTSENPDKATHRTSSSIVDDTTMALHDAFALRDWDEDGLISAKDAATVLNRRTGISVSENGMLELAKLPDDALASRLLSFEDVLNAYSELQAIAVAHPPKVPDVGAPEERNCARAGESDEENASESEEEEEEEEEEDGEEEENDEDDDDGVSESLLVAQEMRLLAAELRAAHAVMEERANEAHPCMPPEIPANLDETAPAEEEEELHRPVQEPSAPPPSPPPAVLPPNRFPYKTDASSISSFGGESRHNDSLQQATIDFLQSKLAEKEMKITELEASIEEKASFAVKEMAEAAPHDAQRDQEQQRRAPAMNATIHQAPFSGLLMRSTAVPKKSASPFAATWASAVGPNFNLNEDILRGTSSSSSSLFPETRANTSENASDELGDATDSSSHFTEHRSAISRAWENVDAYKAKRMQLKATYGI